MHALIRLGMKLQTKVYCIPLKDHLDAFGVFLLIGLREEQVLLKLVCFSIYYICKKVLVLCKGLFSLLCNSSAGRRYRACCKKLCLEVPKLTNAVVGFQVVSADVKGYPFRKPIFQDLQQKLFKCGWRKKFGSCFIRVAFCIIYCS